MGDCVHHRAHVCAGGTAGLTREAREVAVNRCLRLGLKRNEGGKEILKKKDERALKREKKERGPQKKSDKTFSKRQRLGLKHGQGKRRRTKTGWPLWGCMNRADRAMAYRTKANAYDQRLAGHARAVTKEFQ